MSRLRHTTGVIKRIETNGFGVVQEEGSNRSGFFNDNTFTVRSPTANTRPVRPGQRVTIEVEDKDDLFIVRSIDPQ